MWHARYPSLMGLVFLEAVVRHESFTRAARELHVTQSAVSHRIRELEEHLGHKLFVREPSSTRPTPRAIHLAAVVRASLSEIARFLDADDARIGEPVIRAEPRELQLGIAPSLANHWLVPMLPEFSSANPGWSLRPRVSLAFQDLSEVDATLRYGAGGYDGVASILLSEETLVAVCTPSLLEQTPDFDIEHALLLQAYTPSSPRPDSPIALWMAAQGLSHRGKSSTFERQSMAVIAASSGQGVAIVPSRMACVAMARGELVLADERSARDPLSYYLVWSPEHAPLEAIEMLHAWMIGALSRV